MMTRTNFFDPNTSELLDKGLAVFFAKPNSFTGEDVVEIHIHGGISTVNLVLKALGSIDQLRLAEPGEFSKKIYEQIKYDKYSKLFTRTLDAIYIQ